MFERFTNRAQRTLVNAQDEAVRLGHDHIGAGHILVGLIDEGGVAAHVITSLGVPLADAREKACEALDSGGTAKIRTPPFAPQAKTVLELSLREAMRLKHDYIGTEHMLVALLREGGPAARVLSDLGADLPLVLRLTGLEGPPEPSPDTEV